MNKKLMAVLSVGVIASSFIGDATMAHADEDVKEAQIQKGFNKNIVDNANELMKIIDNAEQTMNPEDIDKAIVAFIDMHKPLEPQDYIVHKSNDVYDQAFYKVFNTINKLDGVEKNNKIVSLHNKLTSQIKKGTGTFYKEYLFYMNNTNQIPEIRDTLMKNVSDIQFIITSPPDMEVVNPDGSVKVPDGPSKEEIQKVIDTGRKNDFAEAEKSGGSEAKQQESVKPEPIRSESVAYEKEGNMCYKITTFYEDGTQTKQEKGEVPKMNYVYCGILDYVDYGGGNVKQEVPDNWDYLVKEQNPGSNLTLQYTVNKGDEKPYYYDSGIRVALNGTASYEQFKDILYQVSVKSKGYVVEDNGKMLVIVEGKPILVKDAKKEYSKEEIESLFKDFEKVDIRIMETRIGKSESLEERIVSKQAKNVQIADKSIELEVNPIVKDERVLLPVEQIAKELEVNVERKDGVLTLKKDNNVVVYRDKKDTISLNGREVKIATSPEYKNDIFMAEIQEMIDIFGFDMLWDGETSTIKINKK
ncbi:copper amine oxidase N-terminal domain-containing protein [Bacillus thuringiensis]|uniref:copper amine oxidase N-terminal domain-containing protein n=1 Tax=Bacillus thuringiensis TaxID=1428 RepID=UPI0024BD15E3|nr:copper amine oxidase N-terminal domain-containing protein [Bacillus thuringiensis]